MTEVAAPDAAEMSPAAARFIRDGLSVGEIVGGAVAATAMALSVVIVVYAFHVTLGSGR